MNHKQRFLRITKTIVAAAAIVVCGIALGHKGIVEERAGLEHEPTKERPFPPSYISTDSGRTLRAEDFESPEVCAGCHPAQYEGWRGSMHSLSFIDPVFQAEWHKAELALDGKALYYCGGCHAPIGTLTQSLSHDVEAGTFDASNEISKRGVSCDVCHQMTDTNFLITHTMEHGNASFNISPGNTKYGPLKDAVSPYHETQYSELHTRADLCANCHNIFHPVNGMPVERTYDEWKSSVYAQHDIVCQDCHMNPVEVAVKIAAELKRPEELADVVEQLKGKAGTVAKGERKIVHNHEFVGGNAVITAVLEPGNKTARRHSAIAEQRLSNAAELKLDVVKLDNGLLDLSVDVRNVAAGHNLPTSLTEVREMWLEILVKDAAGKVLLSSGQLDDHGTLDEKAVKFHKVAVTAEGVPTHNPWEMNHFVEDTTIPPKGHKLSHFAFPMPETDSLHIDVRLNYRSAPQHFIDHLLGEGKVKLPVIRMEHEVRAYSVSDGKLVLQERTVDPVDSDREVAAN